MASAWRRRRGSPPKSYLTAWIKLAILCQAKKGLAILSCSVSYCEFLICFDSFDCIFSEIDALLGRGKRNGNKFFLVHFEGQKENELIDWETAKDYSLAVMECFGSRLVWGPLNEVANANDVANTNDPAVDATAQGSSQLDALSTLHDI